MTAQTYNPETFNSTTSFEKLGKREAKLQKEIQTLILNIQRIKKLNQKNLGNIKAFDYPQDFIHQARSKADLKDRLRTDPALFSQNMWQKIGNFAGSPIVLVGKVAKFIADKFRQGYNPDNQSSGISQNMI